MNQPLSIARDVPLAPHTTLGLGGKAHYFARCPSVEALREHLCWAADRNLPLQILGGGSNILFADEGFAGLVLKVDLRGIETTPSPKGIEVRAAAGEGWDQLVRSCTQRGWGGIECLAGIPGQVGATPIQNVGAYGQEVKDTILKVEALDRRNLEMVHFSNAECNFSYRQSRFKDVDRDRYIVTAVHYRLHPDARPQVRYAELQRHLQATTNLDELSSGAPALEAARQAVVHLRRKKSMVVDPTDANSRSAGSFFLNPLLSSEDFSTLEQTWRKRGHTDGVPSFPTANGVKVPAAWLVENAGFHRGYRQRGAAVSDHHALALVNRGGTAEDLLALARAIRHQVESRFGIRLEAEPVLPQPL